ncbi:MAG TPA: TonB family protein [Terracidiphilus sp.]|nr:TonB family protein [Terracidiphilus sp.]
MPTNYTAGQLTFGLLPEPQGRSASFVVSSAINATILLICVGVGMMARHVVLHKFEQTELIFPHDPPPPPKVKPPDPIKLTQPPPVVHQALQQMVAPKIRTPEQPKPKPVEMQAKLAVPAIRMAKPAVIMQPQPKAAMTAAMPSLTPQAHPSTKPVHFGEIFGATPNPNAVRPATVAAIGNPYGGNEGPAVAPHGVVGSAGIGNGLRKGSNAGIMGRVASAGVPGATGTGNTGTYGKVGSVGIPATPVAASAVRQADAEPQSTALQVISKPPVRYTPEAKQLKVQGDVVLRVTFTAEGQVVVQGVVRGLGHGLDQEAMHEAQQIKFRPATRDGHPVNLTTDIIITFQLA